MSRYRQIHCLIWNDDKFPFLKDDTKLVFFHLLTTPFSTPFGLFKASIGALADEMRWSPKKYEKALKDAIAHGMVEYDPKAYVIFIPNFLKYNWPTSINQVKSWKKIFDELPNSPLKIKFLQRFKALTDGKNDAISHAIKDAFALASLIQEQEQEQEQEIYISSSQPDGCDEQNKLKEGNKNFSFRGENKSTKASDSAPPLEENKPSVEEKNVPSCSASTTRPKRKDKTFSEDSEEYRLAKLLLDCILEHRPNFKRPNLQSWAKHIDLMLRVDKRTPEEVEEVIRWCQKDSFWQANILSTKKLREKFDQLAIKMQKIRAGPMDSSLIGKVSSTTARNIRVIANWLEKK